MSIDWPSKIPGFVQTVLAVGGLVFAGGTLYGDVQDIKKDVSQTKGLAAQAQVLETKLANQKETQDATIKVMQKLTDTVERLSTSVTRLEVQINKR
jgi:hypothetical protein